MATTCYANMKALAVEWEKLYPSAVFSGCVGDARHALAGGYHIGRRYQNASNYSVVRPDDRPGNGPDDAAAALDMSMSTTDMVKCTARLALAFNNKADPRRKYLNAFNGWDGSGDAIRFDVYAKRKSWATPDHKWHIHLECRRRHVTSETARKAILSILKGESVEKYLESIGEKAVKPAMAVAGKTSKPMPPRWPGKVFSRDVNMRPDADLKKWQQAMIDRGWTTLGRADGVFGPKTEAVVKAFQKLGKVPVDGVIGKLTWPLPWIL
jgi:peptidoglycan hydrolase-like protein with peptidoglycan-binding domain